MTFPSTGNTPNVTHCESPKSCEETLKETGNRLSVSLLSVPPLVVPPLNVEKPRRNLTNNVQKFLKLSDLSTP